MNKNNAASVFVVVVVVAMVAGAGLLSFFQARQPENAVHYVPGDTVAVSDLRLVRVYWPDSVEREVVEIRTTATGVDSLIENIESLYRKNEIAGFVNPSVILVLGFSPTGEYYQLVYYQLTTDSTSGGVPTWDWHIIGVVWDAYAYRESLERLGRR